MATERWTCMALAFVPLCLIGCSKQGGQTDALAYRGEIEQYRQARLARLTSDTGWLTLCGLFWLSEGANRCGSDSSNEVVFPKGKTPALVGTLWREGVRVRFDALPGIEVRHADSLVTSLMLKSDIDESGPTILKIGTLGYYVIKRGGKLGVRVKDTENPARINFKGLEYFPIDAKWRINSRFEPYVPPRVIMITNVVNTVEEYSSPGALVFSHEGKEYRLDAVAEPGADRELFIMFSDQTSGKETYGGGRQLYTDVPDGNGEVILDFNKAYNWPCVFSAYATCPIPPRQNRLELRVEAGEKMYMGHD